MVQRFDELAVLACTYLGQEWDEIADTPDDVVRAFAAHRGQGAVAALLAEIEMVLGGSPPEAELRTLWRQTLRSSFAPARVGMTYEQWFERIVQILDR